MLAISFLLPHRSEAVGEKVAGGRVRGNPKLTLLLSRFLLHATTNWVPSYARVVEILLPPVS
jgi:hypothetical protein